MTLMGLENGKVKENAQFAAKLLIKYLICVKVNQGRQMLDKKLLSE